MVSPARQFNATADEERVLEVVRELVGEMGNASAVRSASPASHLDRELGLGSLERVELLLRLEKFLAHGSMKKCWPEPRRCRT